MCRQFTADAQASPEDMLADLQFSLCGGLTIGRNCETSGLCESWATNVQIHLIST